MHALEHLDCREAKFFITVLDALLFIGKICPLEFIPYGDMASAFPNSTPSSVCTLLNPVLTPGWMGAIVL